MVPFGHGSDVVREDVKCRTCEVREMFDVDARPSAGGM